MKTFRTLELAIEFYGMVEEVKITGHLREQLLRAASSISLNLSEGNARGSAKDKRNFFQNAYASFRECQTVLKLLKIEDTSLNELADKLGGHLYKLINSQIKQSPNWKQRSTDI